MQDWTKDGAFAAAFVLTLAEPAFLNEALSTFPATDFLTLEVGNEFFI